MTRWSATDLIGAQTYWITTVVIAGRTQYYSTEAFNIPSSVVPGGFVATEAAIDPVSLRKAGASFGGAPESRTARITVLPAEAPGVWIAQGHTPEGQPAEIALWRDGDTWEQRRVQLRGIVRGCSWGAAGQPLSLEVEESVTADRLLYPTAAMAITSETWPDAASSAVGLSYPVILGQPGRTGIAAAPALFVESVLAGGARDLLLVAGHPVAAANVTIYDDSGANESLVIEHIDDGTGQRVAVVDLAGATVVSIDPDGNYSSSWVSGPGLLAVSGAGGATGAGDIVLALLVRSGLRVDQGQAMAARDALNGYLIDAFLDLPTAPSEWIASALLPILPAAMVAGVDGWWLRPLTVRPRLTDCIAQLIPGAGITRDGEVVGEGESEIANDLSIRLAIGTETDDPTVDARLGPTTDNGSHSSADAVRSASRYGVRAISEESVALHDIGTAYRVLRWWAQVRAWPRWRARYLVGPEWAWLEPGDVLRLTDSDLSIDGPVLLDAVEYQEGGLLALEVIQWRR